MKKLTTLILALICANMLLADNDPNEIPADFTVGGVGYKYNVGNPTEVTVHNRDANSLPANLVIPAIVTNNGTTYNVTSIGFKAFNNCNSLISVSIPSSVTTIENNAFLACGSLTTITISEGVTFIDHGAFSGCHDLTSISIPNSVTTIGHSVFKDCI